MGTAGSTSRLSDTGHQSGEGRTLGTPKSLACFSRSDSLEFATGSGPPALTLIVATIIERGAIQAQLTMPSMHASHDCMIRRCSHEHRNDGAPSGMLLLSNDYCMIQPSCDAGCSMLRGPLWQSGSKAGTTTHHAAHAHHGGANNQPIKHAQCTHSLQLNDLLAYPAVHLGLFCICLPL
jgi:hypothetical protein